MSYKNKEEEKRKKEIKKLKKIYKNLINEKLCLKCGLIKSLDAFYVIKNQPGKYSSRCKECIRKASNLWHKKNPEYFKKQNQMRHRPMAEAKDCALYLGVVIAEKALSKFFKHIKRMLPNNPGFDFLCNKDFKIDVKSSCIKYAKDCSPRWQFAIRKNKIADYFLLIAFNDRKNLEPQHVWLIPGEVINEKINITIVNVEKTLNKWAEYEKPLDKVIACCNKMKKKN
jgi:hypothetical protein